MRIVAIALLAVGILALVYGGFSFTQRTHEAKIGPVEISMNETRRVNVPVWAGVVLPGRRRRPPPRAEALAVHARLCPQPHRPARAFPPCCGHHGRPHD